MKKWERESLNPEEIDLVLAAARNDEEIAMISGLVYTGMRANELLRFRKDWVHWRKGSYGSIRIPVNDDYVPVPGTKGRGPKTKKVRYVLMNARLNKVLKAWFKGGHNGFFRTYNHVYNVCVRSGEAAGLYTSKKLAHGVEYTVCAGVDHAPGWHFTPHINRHTYVTQVSYNTILRDWEVGQIVGHKDGRTVRDVYLHTDKKKIAQTIEDSGWLER